MKTFLAAVLSTALLGFAADRQQSFTGVITDTMCGADHKSMKVAPDSKCVVECVKHGSKYALLVGNNVYTLSDQQTPERFAARKVKVTGVLDEKTRTLRADKIEPFSGAAPEATDHSQHMH